jgi:cytochrome c biogenesis protein CcdA
VTRGKRAVFLALFLLLSVVAVACSAATTELVFFYEQGCSHCSQVADDLQALLDANPTLVVARHEIHDPGSVELLDKLVAAYGVELGTSPVPYLFVGDVAALGGTYYGLYEEPYPTSSGRSEELALREAVDRAIAAQAPSPLSRIEGDTAADAHSLTKGLTISAIVVAALVDSVNPCTFAVLVLLLGTLLVMQKQGRKHLVLKAGLAFTAAIYVSYFLMGIGIFSAIQAAGVQKPFIMVVSCLAILLGIWNMKDYFAYGKWFTVEVPQRWRPTVKRLTASVASVPGAVLIGVLDSLFLLPCSSGPYVAILALISKDATKLQGIWYLLFYNVIFVLPLIAITLAVHFGYTTTARAERWRSARLGKLHLASGILMFLLGAGMLAATLLGWM